MKTWHDYFTSGSVEQRLFDRYNKDYPDWPIWYYEFFAKIVHVETLSVKTMLEIIEHSNTHG